MDNETTEEELKEKKEEIKKSKSASPFHLNLESRGLAKTLQIGSPRFLSSHKSPPVAYSARESVDREYKEFKEREKEKDKEKDKKETKNKKLIKEQKLKEELIKEQLKLMGLEWKEGRKISKHTRTNSQPPPFSKNFISSPQRSPSGERKISRLVKEKTNSAVNTPINYLQQISCPNNNNLIHKLTNMETTIFGMELDFLIDRQKKNPLFGELKIPNLVFQLVELLILSDGVKENGIFRLCGHHAKQTVYEKFIDRKGDFQFPFKIEKKKNDENNNNNSNNNLINNLINNNNENKDENNINNENNIEKKKDENNNLNDENNNKNENNNENNLNNNLNNKNNNNNEINEEKNNLNNENNNKNENEEEKKSIDDWQKGEIDILPKLDVHTAGDLLKSFLRKLPDPIIPRSPFFPHFIQFSAMSKEELRVTAYAAMIKKLPANRYHLLKYLCSFFNLISENKEKTLMGSSNLGVIFAPSFFGSMDKDVDLDVSSIDHISMCKESKFTAEITAEIILHQSVIFSEEVEEVKTFIAKEFIVLENNNLHSIIRGDSILIIKKYIDRNTFGIIVGDGIFTEISAEDSKFFEGIEEVSLSDIKRRPITSLFASKRMINAAKDHHNDNNINNNNKKKEEKKRNAFSVTFFRKN